MASAIGAIPTTSKSAVLTLDYLLSHPELLPKAQAAARADDDVLMAKYVLECLRFNSFAAGNRTRVCRGLRGRPRCPPGDQDPQGRLGPGGDAIGDDGLAGTEITEAVPAGPTRLCVHALRLRAPHLLRYYINLVQIPRIVKAVLKRDGLRRAAGPEGQMQSTSPFPVHMRLEFNP